MDGTDKHISNGGLNMVLSVGSGISSPVGSRGEMERFKVYLAAVATPTPEGNQLQPSGTRGRVQTLKP